MNPKIIIIGGGAAGFFAAIVAAETHPKANITILERGKNVLEKVRISGGGRCNVTHACFMPRELVKNYPRGDKALMSPFTRFAAGDTIEWFENHGVKLKIEDDGRMFPTTDDSQTIVDCLMGAALKNGVKILRGYRVDKILPPQADMTHFTLKTNEGDIECDKLVVATGSSNAVWTILEGLGHTLVKPVPSLFTFNIKDPRLDGLAGLSVENAEIKVENSKLKANGPLLITHWGLSGPGILRLSSWGARELHDTQYDFSIKINWTGFDTTEDVKEVLNELKFESKKQVSNTPQYLIPSRLWERFLKAADIPDTLRWADTSKKHLQALAEQLTQSHFKVKGKSTFKEEFVTAGGIDLDEINFKTFESKLIPNLFFAGEVLDIDAITGGFNFQAAWTGGWHVGKAIIANL
jgi:predicted Rossmann fold flavoprotein